MLFIFNIRTLCVCVCLLNHLSHRVARREFLNNFIMLMVQDRHMKTTGDSDEPFVDPQQDYELLLGYENATHTVMRFRRALNTCDRAHDVVITVSRECACIELL